jgi:CheY-like chemotaxis protein
LSGIVDEEKTLLLDGQAATILVVDDDAAVRELTVQALEELNYRVIEVEDGSSALDRLRASKVDLILLDLVMPGMSGRQLATRIRANDPEQAILFMTGYDDLSGSDDPFANEMVMKKPFKLVELGAAIGQVLGRESHQRRAWNVTPLRSSKVKN